MDVEKYLSEKYPHFFDDFDIPELQEIIEAMNEVYKKGYRDCMFNRPI